MDGWINISKEQLLGLCDLPNDLEIMGARWFSGTKTLKLVLSGESIPHPGGEIVSVDPIQTEKGLRDAAVSSN